MELRPDRDGMEKWGVMAIMEESQRLLQKHSRLFVPFYVAFCLSATLLTMLPVVLVSSTTAPTVLGTRVFFAFTANDLQGGLLQVPTDIVTVVTMTIVFILVPILSALGLGAVTYIVAYIYSNDDDDDKNVTNKVFKLLPHALVRSFVTALWTWLLLQLVFIAHFLLGLLITGSTASEYFLVLVMIPWFISAFFLGLLFVFSPVIAVLEPAHYGRDALHRSAKMVKVGGPGTILAVGLVGFFLFAVCIDPVTLQIASLQPAWMKYLIGVFGALVISIYYRYFFVVFVVMYFVYTSRLDAATAAPVSSLPTFAAASALMDHPYKPLAAENPPVSCVG